MRSSNSDTYRTECLRKAEACRKQATRHETRRTHWIKQAEEWVRRARDGFDGDARASTHEVCEGRLIAKPSMK
jgi:hypothetical protein